jgi:hypothetical protein
MNAIPDFATEDDNLLNEEDFDEDPGEPVDPPARETGTPIWDAVIPRRAPIDGETVYTLDGQVITQTRTNNI